MITEEIKVILSVANLLEIYEYCEKQENTTYLLELTKEQVLELFTLKRFFQDQLGVHYFNSGWNQLQDKGFINDIIQYAKNHWYDYNIEQYFKRVRKYLPKDYSNN